MVSKIQSSEFIYQIATLATAALLKPSFWGLNPNLSVRGRSSEGTSTLRAVRSIVLALPSYILVLISFRKPLASLFRNTVLPLQHVLEYSSFFHKCSWMSANVKQSDSSFRAGYLTPFPTCTEASSPGMELPPSRLSSQQQLNETISVAPGMSTLAVRAPMSFLPSPRDMFWDERRLQHEAPPRPRSLASPLERIELPSIRQVWFINLH